VPNWNPSEEQFSEKDFGSISEGYIYIILKRNNAFGYLRTRTMSKGYGPALEGYMLYPEVMIPTDKIEDESEKNHS
jgi:hypothetical protein